MPKLGAEYFAAALQFDRLARRETRPEVQELLKAQASACHRLAIKRGRDGAQLCALEQPPLRS